MRFIKKATNSTPIVDTVFAVAKEAKEAVDKHGKEAVTNATIGALCDEEGQLVAFETVYQNYNQISNRQKAAYAASFAGNENYRKQVFQWVTQGTVSLHHSVIATPGGTGAVAMTFTDILDAGETVIIPEIAWSSYQLMASDNQLHYQTYQLFEGDVFNITSFKNVCLEVLSKQRKLLVVINDPCHNPTGYSLTKAEWQEIIEFLNECSKQGPCVILNDIAYIDYSYQDQLSRGYMENFHAIADNLLVIIAFSISKSLTSYGLRCGAAVILAQNKETVQEIETVYEKAARARWSNIPNAAMDNFVAVTTEKLDSYLQEKAGYVDLLKQRSTIFLHEAKACGLNCYPYKEGFFITVKVEDETQLDACHQALIDQLIFTVKVEKGIRIAICSLPLAKCTGLAVRIKAVINS